MALYYIPLNYCYYYYNLKNDVQLDTQLPQSRRQVHDVLSAAESVRPISDFEVTCGPMTRPATLNSSATSSSNSTDFSSSSSSSSSIITLSNSTWTELAWTGMNKLTQLHDVFIGHARQRHDCIILGCSETRAVSARLVLNACISMWSFSIKFSSVQFKCCRQAFKIYTSS